jgi:hypothetical protein
VTVVFHHVDDFLLQFPLSNAHDESDPLIIIADGTLKAGTKSALCNVSISWAFNEAGFSLRLSRMKINPSLVIPGAVMLDDFFRSRAGLK